MLYLLDQLTDMSGKPFSMAGLISGKAVMQKKLAAIGSQWVNLPLFEKEIANNSAEDITKTDDVDPSKNTMRGHSFHYSQAEINLAPICQTTHYPRERAGEFVYQDNNILASYMHWYFPSNPGLTLRIFNKARCL